MAMVKPILARSEQSRNDEPVNASTPPSASSRTAIACTLSGRSLEGRVAEWASLAREALIDGKPRPGGVVLRYRRTARAEPELRRLVALEAECCAFLKLELSDERDQLVLTVSAPREAVALVRECWGVTDVP